MLDTEFYCVIFIREIVLTCTTQYYYLSVFNVTLLESNPVQRPRIAALFDNNFPAFFQRNYF